MVMAVTCRTMSIRQEGIGLVLGPAIADGDGAAVHPSDGELLDAALEAFAEQGYAGTSVRELARRLGVHHNHIPQRFGSKERLWYTAVDHGFGLILEELMSAFEEPAHDELARLRTMVVRFIEINAARPALLRIVNSEAVIDGPRLEYLFRAYIEPVRRYGSHVLSRLEARGEVSTSSAGILYFLMAGGIGGPIIFPGLADRLGVGLDPADPDAVHRLAVEMVDVLFDGLRRRDV
jgi:AcrR family transcriptional regulator